MRVRRSLLILLTVSFVLLIGLWLLSVVLYREETIISPLSYAKKERLHHNEDDNLRPTSKVFRGKVSWYSTQECENPDCITKSGERFTDDGLTGACLANYPFGSRFRLVYRGRSVSFVCNDRGGFGSLGRVLDVSPAVFSALAPLSAGVITAEIEVIEAKEI